MVWSSSKFRTSCCTAFGVLLSCVAVYFVILASAILVWFNNLYISHPAAHVLDKSQSQARKAESSIITDGSGTWGYTGPDDSEIDEDWNMSMDELLAQNNTLSVLLETIERKHDLKFGNLRGGRACRATPLPSSWCPASFKYYPRCARVVRHFRVLRHLTFICLADGLCGSSRRLGNCHNHSVYIMTM